MGRPRFVSCICFLATWWHWNFIVDLMLLAFLPLPQFNTCVALEFYCGSYVLAFLPLPQFNTCFFFFSSVESSKRVTISFAQAVYVTLWKISLENKTQ